jgi:SAM-dependent methyltransferase
VAPPDVSHPGFWEARYALGEDGWELGGPTPSFVSLLAGDEAGPPGRLAVPGCGRGHDAILFARHGFDVTGFDFARPAIEAATALAARAGVADRCRFEGRDLFELPQRYPEAFDAVLEYTCFCAIDPSRRPEYVEAMAAVLRPEGRLIALFYPLREGTDGPPFPVARAEIDRLFGLRFELVLERVPADSIERRRGQELLTVWRKRSTTSAAP